MEQNTLTEEPATRPIDDVKPPIPDVSTTGAEFSADPEPGAASEFKTEPMKPEAKDEAQPEVVAPPPELAEEKPDDKEQSISPESSPNDTGKVSAKDELKDTGTHRTQVKAASSGKGLAAFVLITGLGLSAFVVYVYTATN